MYVPSRHKYRRNNKNLVTFSPDELLLDVLEYAVGEGGGCGIMHEPLTAHHPHRSCGVVQFVQAMLLITCMYKLILCMVRDVRTITT